MSYKILFFFCFIFLFSCAEQSKKINYSKKFKNYSNKGFTLVYDEKLFKNKFINKKLNNRSLLIFNNVLEEEAPPEHRPTSDDQILYHRSAEPSSPHTNLSQRLPHHQALSTLAALAG